MNFYHFIYYFVILWFLETFLHTCVQSACSPDMPVLRWAGMSTRWDWPSLDCTFSPGEKTVTVESRVKKKTEKGISGRGKATILSVKTRRQRNGERSQEKAEEIHRDMMRFTQPVQYRPVAPCHLYKRFRGVMGVRVVLHLRRQQR